jgi:hypothetical protein
MALRNFYVVILIKARSYLNLSLMPASVHDSWAVIIVREMRKLHPAP